VLEAVRRDSFAHLHTALVLSVATRGAARPWFQERRW